MKLLHHPTFRVVAGLVCLLASQAAAAASFEIFAQSRSVSMNGQLLLSDYDTGETLTASAAPSAQTQPGDLGAFNASVGLGDLVLVGAQGQGQGAGRAAQSSSLQAQAIRFDGVADVFMSGSVSGNAVVLGSGSASSALSSRFSVAHTTQVLLTMDSEIGPRNNQYSFSLGRDDGSVLWNQTALYDDEFGEIRSFSQNLWLTPGTYVLDASLSAFSMFENDTGSSGRALAQFSLTPVPEPESLVLWMTGLAGLLGARAHARQRKGTKEAVEHGAGPRLAYR